MTNHQIVKKLIGEIMPVGATHIDKERMENLNNMCVLVSHLLMDITDVAENLTRQEHSMREAGKAAQDFINDTIENLR